MAFKKGEKRPPGAGRKKGSQNKATKDVRRLCQRLVNNPTYMKNFSKALRDRTLPPFLEALVWRYAWGNPPQELQFVPSDKPQRFVVNVVKKREVKRRR